MVLASFELTFGVGRLVGVLGMVVISGFARLMDGRSVVRLCICADRFYFDGEV